MIYIVDIEAVETRYTKQWKEYLPKQLRRATNQEVTVISGGDTPQATTPGAFLNFGGTNVYKSAQMEKIGKMFCDGKIKNGDYFLYTDAWNPTVLQLKYMAELLKVKINEVASANKAFEDLMGGETDARKRFIAENSLKVSNLDV